MSFQGNEAKLQRLRKEDAAWKLLRAENASFIIAFLIDTFDQAPEVPFDRARILLEAELSRYRDENLWTTETNAGTYLNQWIQSGWLRDVRGETPTLIKTHAAEVAIRFTRGLEERTTGASASNLKIVQDAVRDAMLAMNPNMDLRTQLLEQKKAEIQQEIDDLNAGRVKHLTEEEQVEKLKDIFQLASLLTGDFRQVEDDIRRIDQELRASMLEEGANRGTALRLLLDREGVLVRSEAGRAFQGFYQLLCDNIRVREFRHEIGELLRRPAAEKLSPHQRQFMKHLVRLLNEESERILSVRRRTDDGLRAYIARGSARERQTVDRLLGELSQLAVELRDAGVSQRTPVGLSVPTGSLSIQSPHAIKLYDSQDEIVIGELAISDNGVELDDDMLTMLDNVDAHEVAKDVKALLIENGPMTVSNLIHHRPITGGHEELVAHVRIARATNATMLDEKEIVEFTDRDGKYIRATIPKFLLNQSSFPDDIDSMAM